MRRTAKNAMVVSLFFFGGLRSSIGADLFVSKGVVILLFFLSTDTGSGFCFGQLLFSTSTAVILSFPPASFAASTSAFAFESRLFSEVNTCMIVPELTISVRPSLHKRRTSPGRKGDYER